MGVVHGMARAGAAREGATHASPLRVGAARVEITPVIGGPMAGYFKERRSTGILDPLYARALVMETDETRIGIVAVDAVCLKSAVTRAVRENAGPAFSAIMVAATHTHTGPVTRSIFDIPADDTFLKALPERIAAALTEAEARLSPVTIHAVRAAVPGLAFNRRYSMNDGSVKMNPGLGNPNIVAPAGPVDPDAVLVTFERLDGTAAASIAHFALHLDTTSGTEYSADYPAGLLARIESALGPDHRSLFLLGFCGDVNHIDVAGPPSQSGPSQAQAIGEKIANALLDALPNRQKLPAGPIRAESAWITGIRRPLSRDHHAAFEAIAAGREWSGDDPLDADIPETLRPMYARERLALMNEPATEDVEAQVLRVGDLAIVGAPGEMFSQYQLDLKRVGCAVALPVSLANGYAGYIPTRKAFAEGGYETWLSRSSFLSPDTGDRWAASVKTLLERVAASAGGSWQVKGKR